MMFSASFKSVSIWIVFVLVGISKVQCKYKGLHCYNSNGFNNMTTLQKIPCIGGICIGAGWNLGMYLLTTFNLFIILLTSSNNQISEFRIPNIYNKILFILFFA